jgi:hypothetical protein
MDLSETRWKGVNYMHLVQNGDQWRDLAKTIMNLRVLSKSENVLTSWVNVSFSRRTFLHGDSLYKSVSLFYNHPIRKVAF